MADDALHYTPLPEDTIAAKSKLPIIVIGVLIVLAVILGIFYYLNVASVPTKKPTQSPTAEPTETFSDEVNIFADMEEQSLSCLDWAKYKARLDQIGQVCTPGCCPWVTDDDPDSLGCRAPADGECKPKGNPCSDGTCWECRFENDNKGFEGFLLLRYQGSQWVSCSEAPTPTPTIASQPICTSPQQCLPLNECETPPSTTTPIGQCPAANQYCCMPKAKVTPRVTTEPSPTMAACIKPTLNVEVECLQCDGEAITQ